MTRCSSILTNPNKFPMAVSRSPTTTHWGQLSGVTSAWSFDARNCGPDRTEPPRQLYPVESLRLKVRRERRCTMWREGVSTGLLHLHVLAILTTAYKPLKSSALSPGINLATVCSRRTFACCYLLGDSGSWRTREKNPIC